MNSIVGVLYMPLSHHAVLSFASIVRRWLLLSLGLSPRPPLLFRITCGCLVIAGFGLQLHSEERGTHHIKLHEFCGGGCDIDAIVQRHLSVRIINAKLFGLFCPKFPDCDSTGVYGRGVMCPSLCLNLGILSANE